VNYQNWLFEIQDHVATITINRPQKLNSLSADTLYELREISHELQNNVDVWCIVLQGAGANFTAGVDVKQIGAMVGQDKAGFAETLRDLQDCIDHFEAISKPIIAKIRGHCVGGGVILATCCDFRVADTTARFHVPEVQLGIAVIMGTQRITRICGVANTKEMIILAEPFDAQKAQSFGLLHRIAEADELDNTVAAITKRLCQLPPRTLSISKRIIDEGEKMSLRASQELEIDLQAELLDSPDLKEAIAAFFEKRPPKFLGK
jgi:enoyl-CoA hydratase/carnithine racemase